METSMLWVDTKNCTQLYKQCTAINGGAAGQICYFELPSLEIKNQNQEQNRASSAINCWVEVLK